MFLNILRNITLANLLKQCVVPENIHTSPTERIFSNTFPPFWKFQLTFIHFLNFFGPPVPPPPRKFQSLLWEKYGYFLELHNELVNVSVENSDTDGNFSGVEVSCDIFLCTWNALKTDQILKLFILYFLDFRYGYRYFTRYGYRAESFLRVALRFFFS